MVQLVSRQLQIWLYLNFFFFFRASSVQGFGLMLLGVSHLVPGSQHISVPKVIATVNYIIFAFSMFHCQ